MNHILTPIDMKGRYPVTLASSNDRMEKRLEVVTLIGDNFKSVTYYAVFSKDSLATAETLAEAVKIYNSI